MEDGQPTGIYEDFMTGFTVNEVEVWGRPTGIAVLPDGGLLVSDDANGTIFRVTHTGGYGRPFLPSAHALRPEAHSPGLQGPGFLEVGFEEVREGRDL